MKSKQETIQKKLKVFLSKGPVSLNYIVDYCIEKNIASRRSLYRAKNQLNVETVLIDDVLCWQLPIQASVPMETKVSANVEVYENEAIIRISFENKSGAVHICRLRALVEDYINSIE